MSDPYQFANVITVTIVSGVVTLLLGLAAMWHIAEVIVKAEAMKAGYAQELYPMTQGTRWVKKR